jgi:hypothetical protein
MNRSRFVACSSLLAILPGACNENFHARYPDVNALQKAGSGARSWFPAPLPAENTIAHRTRTIVVVDMMSLNL